LSEQVVEVYRLPCNVRSYLSSHRLDLPIVTRVPSAVSTNLGTLATAMGLILPANQAFNLNKATTFAVQISSMQAWFKTFSKLTFYCTLLVILAGSVVRTTQSGMGCPDWPRCFGYYIPPSEDSQVRYHSSQEYRKGMMIILNDTLWRAESTFVAPDVFNRAQWKKYPKHDYSDFVVHQTWIEYINRLLGALLGMLVFGMLITSFSYRKTKPSLIVLSFGLLFVTGFQAWLGKLVVDGNLIPQSISIHMIGAFVLLMLAQMVLKRISPTLNSTRISGLRMLALGAASLVIIQVLIGTQVREEIDVISKSLGFDMRAYWVDELSSVYLLHRAVSLIVTALCGYVAYLAFTSNNERIKRLGIAAFAFVGVEILAGLILGFAGMPAIAQPIHLLFATLLFWSMFALFLEAKGKTDTSL
jgi:heme a synthase